MMGNTGSSRPLEEQTSYYYQRMSRSSLLPTAISNSFLILSDGYVTSTDYTFASKFQCPDLWWSATIHVLLFLNLDSLSLYYPIDACKGELSTMDKCAQRYWRVDGFLTNTGTLLLPLPLFDISSKLLLWPRLSLHCWRRRRSGFSPTHPMPAAFPWV